MTENHLKTLVKTIAQGLVNNPEKAEVTIFRPSPNLFEIKIYAALPDIRLIIGKHGRNITALRTLLYATLAKDDIRCYVSVHERL